MDALIRVLLVDDEPSLLDVIKESLEIMGPMEVTVANSVDEALSLIRGGDFEVVVSDYQMPVKDGLVLLSDVKSIIPNLPFILFTGKGREEVVIEALNRGADYYLQKGGAPASQFTELVHVIKKAVRGRRAESGLKASESKYRSFIQNLKGVVYQTKCDSFVPDMFEGEVEALTGYPPDVFLGGRIPWDALIVPEDLSILMDRNRNLMEDGDRLSEIKYHIRRKDGTIRRVSDVRHCIYSCGRPSLIAGMIYDITEKEALERALNESETKWRFALDGSKDGVWDLDLVTKEVLHSPGSRSMLGYTEDDDIDDLDKWSGLIHPDDADRTMSMIKDCIYKGTGMFELENRVRCKDGSYKWMLARGKVMSSDATGKPLRIIGTHTDIDQLKRNEAVLKEQMREIATKGALIEESEETFRTFLRGSYDAIALVDEDGKVVEWNDSMVNLTGIGRDRAVGSAFFDLMMVMMTPEKHTPEHVQFLKEEIAGALRTGKAYFFSGPLNAELIRQDGERRIVQQIVFPIPTKKGFRVGIISRDITERERADRELKQSRDLLRTVIDDSYDALFIHELDGKIVDVNRRLTEMYRIPREEALKLSVQDFSAGPEYDSDEHKERMRMVLAGEDHLFPWKARRPIDGSSFDVEVYLTQVLMGEKVLLLATTRDVTERKRSEMELKKAEEKYRQLVQNSHDIIYTIQPDGIMTFVSPSWTDLLGHDPSEIVGSSYGRFIYDDDRPACEDYLRRTVETGMRQPAVEYRVFHKDGSLRWHRSNIIPLFDERKEMVSLIGSAVDLTDYKLAVNALALSNRKLSLLSSITRHDILNQIMAAQGYIELARMTRTEGSRDKYYDKIAMAMGTIQRHIMFTREYERLGVKEPTWMTVRSIVEKISDGHLPMVVDCTGVSVFADPMIETVFENLMDNTRRHANGATVVMIGCHRTDDELIITWEDDGCGVPFDHKRLIFERGYGKNTGLGLFLCREILGITGISIVEDGEPGKGARFKMVVPNACFRIDK